MSNSSVPSAPPQTGSHRGPHGGFSWANVAAKASKDEASTQQQQRPDQNEWPTMNTPSMPRDDKKPQQIEVLSKQLQATTEASRREQREAEKCSEKLKIVELELSKMRAQLDVTRRKLLSLQPPQDISDDQVKRVFDDLCQNIEDWVDTECRGIDGFEQQFRNQQWTHQEMRLFEQHITEDDVTLSQQFPDIIANIVMNAIFSFVYDFCLREERWCLWGRPNDEKFLNSLVDVISRSGSSGGTSNNIGNHDGLKFSHNPRLRCWRSDTFKAIQGRCTYTQQRKTELATATNQLSFLLKHFANKAPAHIKERLQTKIIETAHNLADLIKASTSGYRFDFVVSSACTDAHLETKEARMYRIVEAETGIEVDELQITDSRSGRLRLCVFPALERVQDNGERLQLSKAVVLFEKTMSLATDAEDVVVDAVKVGASDQIAIELAGESVISQGTSEEYNCTDDVLAEKHIKSSRSHPVAFQGQSGNMAEDVTQGRINSWVDSKDHTNIQW